MLSTKPHILIIDDNEDILMMLSAMLRHKGYKVSVKDDTENIESDIAQIAPDLILMDMLLSGADGCEICKQLKASTSLSHIPIIMISAHPQARTGCIAAGADCFLEKPFEMNELVKTIAGMLEPNKL